MRYSEQCFERSVRCDGPTRIVESKITKAAAVVEHCALNVRQRQRLERVELKVRRRNLPLELVVKEPDTCVGAHSSVILGN